MHFVRGLANLKPCHRRCVASIGNYDGVHLGHQALIRHLRQHADRLGLPVTVVTFEPQPQEFFVKANAHARLTTLREKLELLAAEDVDTVLCLRFDATLAQMQAPQFVRRVLIEGIDVRHLVVGDDFRFGKNRAGDFAVLEGEGRRYGFGVERTPTFELGGQRVSSTRIRQALAAGELREAQRLLGRPYAISGRVAHGDKRGRAWGFPTANLHLNRKRAPLTGVFTVQVQGLGPQPVEGVANLGNRPTVGASQTLLEVHLIDFDATIYGRRIRVEFLDKLRDEERFDTFEQLRAQIGRDKRRAQEYFATRAAQTGSKHTTFNERL